MNDFKLDVSGVVIVRRENVDRAPDYHGVRWPDLSPFEQGYGHQMADALYEALIQQGYSLEAAAAAVAFRNWAPEALARIREDCAAAIGLGDNDEENGAAFWRWRNDPALQMVLQSVHGDRFPPLTIYIDANGKVNPRDA